MGNFESFTPTRMIFGKNTHQQAGRIIKKYGFKKMLMCFDGADAKKSRLLDAVTGALETEGIQYVTLGGTQTNPALAKAKEEVELCLREGVDLVLAAGGGNVVDSVRRIVDDAGNPDAGVWTYFHQEAASVRALPVGVILTPSASGSEMSTSCVITDEENGSKCSFNNVTHRPLFPICSPELTCTVGKYQIVCNTMGIIAHALERRFSRTGDTELTDRIAEALLESTVETGRIADKESDSYRARATLIWGGSLSHNGLTGAGRDSFIQVHQLEHKLSGTYPSTAHGAGLAVLWPSWAKFVYSGDVSRSTRYVVRVRNIDMDFDCPINTVLAGIRATGDFYKSLGMPSSSKKLGMGEERLEEMAEKCTNMDKRTLPGVRKLSKEEMMEIYRVAMGGQPGWQNNDHRSLACPVNKKETENGHNQQPQEYTQVLKQGSTV